jgi:hypothetical protein
MNLDSWACKICKAREIQPLNRIIWKKSGPSGRELEGVGLRPLAFWDCGFEFRRGHGYLSLVNVVYCQVEVSATSWSLFQRSPTECGVSVCDRVDSIMRRHWPIRWCCPVGEKESERKTLLESHRRTWEDNTKINLHSTVCGGNYQIRLAQGKMAGSWDYVEGFHNTGKLFWSAELL